MIRKLLGLAALTVACGACHSGGTYFQSAEPMPYGPGVVDCAWFQHTENAYVRDRCWTPGPVAEVRYVVPVMPRAPHGDPAIGCPEPVRVVAAAPTAPAPRGAVVVRQAMPVETRTVVVQRADLIAPQARVTVQRPGIAFEPEPAVRYEPPTVTIAPGVEFDRSAGADSLAPPKPGAPLPAPARWAPQAR